MPGEPGAVGARSASTAAVFALSCAACCAPCSAKAGAGTTSTSAMTAKPTALLFIVLSPATRPPKASWGRIGEARVDGARYKSDGTFDQASFITLIRLCPDTAASDTNID